MSDSSSPDGAPSTPRAADPGLVFFLFFLASLTLDFLGPFLTVDAIPFFLLGWPDETVAVAPDPAGSADDKGVGEDLNEAEVGTRANISVAYSQTGLAACSGLAARLADWPCKRASCDDAAGWLLSMVKGDGAACSMKKPWSVKD